MDRGFTSTPNALDDLGLGPYHHRVLVFIVRWMGMATIEKPFIPLSVEYIAKKTCIGITKVKECIQDLEHEFGLIAVRRRKRLRNMYDIRPLFTALLKRQAGVKSIEDRVPAPSPGIEAGVRPEGASNAFADAGEDADWSPNDGPEEEADTDLDDERQAHEGRPARFGVPSYGVEGTIHPGMDEEDEAAHWKPRSAQAVRGTPAPNADLSEKEKQQLLICARLELPGCFTRMMNVGHRQWPFEWANEFGNWVSPDQIEDTLRELQKQPALVTARSLASAVLKKYGRTWAKEYADGKNDTNLPAPTSAPDATSSVPPGGGPTAGPGVLDQGAAGILEDSGAATPA
jgi:hypothetical protein